MEALLSIFLILCFAAIFITFVIAILSGLYGFFVSPAVELFRVYGGVSISEKEILEKKFSYYQQLSPSMKKEFEKRLKYFLMNKTFVSKGNLTGVTEEMKVLVGACAVQVTFGYSPLKLSSFPKIILYPGKYYSSVTKRYHIGEVNTKGAIVLSWEDFIKGYSIQNDGYNVGLHEMAHATKFEDFTGNDEYAFIHESDLHHWYRVSTSEYERVRRKQKSFIRSYAGTNREEFFAVSVEQFFEQPEEFKKQLPDLYNALVRLLRQDPIKIKG